MSFLSKLFTSNGVALEKYIGEIASNPDAQRNASASGLAIQTISWEDTARHKNSVWGPNISDMTLCVAKSNNRLPMIRYPNFSDLTCDTPIENFKLTVGNETEAGTLTTVSLKDYLININQYVKTSSGRPLVAAEGSSGLYDPRDTAILTSAQYCLLPLHKGTVEYNVNLYNYQSYSEDPAVLVIVSSKKGTSAQTVSGGSTSLFFNSAGQAANYVAERMKDERQRLGKTVEGKMDKDEEQRNCLLIFQVPLKQTKRSRSRQLQDTLLCCVEGCEVIEQSGKLTPLSGNDGYWEPLSSINNKSSSLTTFKHLESQREQSVKMRGIDRGMISVGKSHGPFVGVGDQQLVRDTRFPIRVTFQQYFVTDTKDIPSELWAEMKADLDKVYVHQKSSLVTESTKRVTEWKPFNDDGI